MRPLTLSGNRLVPGKGEVAYYAQNDGLWEKMVYETRDSKKSRPFGDGGCAPSAVAMAIRQMVQKENLNAILGYAKSSYSLCLCSVNTAKCRCGQERYFVTSDRDFERFLPLVYADFAAGNNTFRVLSRTEDKGTATGFIHHLAKAYGLFVTIVSDYQTALDALQNGQAVVAHSRAGSVFTNTGHYVTLAHADDENLYVLDPLCRENYTTKNASHLTVHEPGLVSLRHEDIRMAGFGSFIIFSVAGDEVTSDAPIVEIRETDGLEEIAEEMAEEVPSEEVQP